MKRSIPAELIELRDEIQSWRESHPGVRIAEHLLERAVGLLDRYSMSAICVHAGVNRETLKRGAAKSRPSALVSRPASSSAAERFVEVSGTQLRAAGLSEAVPRRREGADSDYRILVDRSDGARLTLFMPMGDSSSINSLFAAFLGS
jgi:hypothetical protein